MTGRNGGRLGLSALARATLLVSFSVPMLAAEAQTTTPRATAPQASTARQLPEGALQVKLVEIPDPASAARVAARALIPDGWSAQGGVLWHRGLPGCADPAIFDWTATSPDGLSSISLFPTELWGASNSTPVTCQWGEFQDVRSYLTAWVQKRYPGARATGFTPRRDFLDAQQPWLDQRLAMVNQTGFGRGWAEAGELRYTHQQDGVEIEGVVAASAVFYGSSFANPLGGPPLSSFTAQTQTTIAARAPKGRLDARTIEALRRSVKLDPTWAAHYMALLAKLAGVQTQGVKDRAAIIVAGGAAMTAATIAANEAAGARAVAAVKNAYADPAPASSSSGAADDRQQRERIEAIRGVETYDDPVYGGTVQLDATYDHAWRVTSADSYILTNDPKFNPGLYDIDAVQLTASR